MVDDTVLSCSWDEFEDWIRQKINVTIIPRLPAMIPRKAGPKTGGLN
jgi:hypothetical protein